MFAFDEDQERVIKTIEELVTCGAPDTIDEVHLESENFGSF